MRLGWAWGTLFTADGGGRGGAESCLDLGFASRSGKG